MPVWAIVLLVVAGICVVGAVPASIIGLAIRNAERSKQATLTAYLNVINGALQMARNDAENPSAAFTLAQLASETRPRGARDWNGPYLTEVPDHPYGGHFVYDRASGKYVSR